MAVGRIRRATRSPRAHRQGRADRQVRPDHRLRHGGTSPPGTHIHTHNVEMHAFERKADAADKPAEAAADLPPATFEGFRRANGKVGTRNYIGILTSVNCSATVAKYIAAAVEKSGILADHPTVDGVVSLVHGTGLRHGRQGRRLRDDRAHPVGLREPSELRGGPGRRPRLRGVPDPAPQGALRHHRGRAFPLLHHPGDRWHPPHDRKPASPPSAKLLPAAAKARRETVPASESPSACSAAARTSYSGITANRRSATPPTCSRPGRHRILSETPEIYGAEHLLAARAETPAIADKLMERIAWWEDYTARNGGEMDNNPRPATRPAVSPPSWRSRSARRTRAATSPLRGVYEYAEPIDAKGFVFMDIRRATTRSRPPARSRPAPTSSPSHRPRLRLRSQARALDEARHQLRSLCPHDRGHGHQLRRRPRRRATRGEGPADLRERCWPSPPASAPSPEALGYGDAEFVPWQIGAVM